jgi:bifunctional non-homologous end joining protein LigD
VGHDDVDAELRDLPAGLLLDGELVAWRESAPYFPDVCRLLLHRDGSIRLTYVIFDVLRLDADDLTRKPYSERRSILESLGLNGLYWTTVEAFDDGHALYSAVCALGLEGVVAKRRTSRYRAGERGWVKVKNPTYWRRDAEREAMALSKERRGRVTA